MLSRFAPNNIVPLRQLFIKYDSLSCKHILQTAMVLHSRILLYVQTDYVLLEKDTKSWSRAANSWQLKVFPARLMLPSISFFLVSIQRTGIPRRVQDVQVASRSLNWASRFLTSFKVFVLRKEHFSKPLFLTLYEQYKEIYWCRALWIFVRFEQ